MNHTLMLTCASLMLSVTAVARRSLPKISMTGSSTVE